MRLINADEMMLKIDMHGTNQFGMLDEDIRQLINDAPTIDAEPVKHGMWLPHKITASSKCSLCRRVFADETPYCPNCGAKMDLYIGKTASSVRNQQRAYGETRGIQQLPAAKVVDKEQFNRAANEIGESDEWTDCDKMMLAVFVNILEERLFGGAK